MSEQTSQPPRKKRRLIVDSQKIIPNVEFKAQLQNTSDIVGKNDLAPATKRAMHYLTYGGVGKFFAYPGRRIQSNALAKMFYRHLTMVTEVRTSDAASLKPLDPELKTPEYHPQTVLISNGVNHVFGDGVSKRNPHSFDYLIKGMHIRTHGPQPKKKREPRVSRLPIIDPPQQRPESPKESVQYQILSLKSELGDGMEEIEQIETIDYDRQDLEGDGLLQVIQYDSDSTNREVQLHGVTDMQSLKLEASHGDDGNNLVYAIAADPSVVLKTGDGLSENNVLYFIAL